MTTEQLLHWKENAEQFVSVLTGEDIRFLIPLLEEKADETRYAAFLALCERSRTHADVYPYWDCFAAKLESKNSFFRNIGIVLLAHNVRWDTEGRFPALHPRYMLHRDDESPITRRQFLQSVPLWIPYAPALLDDTARLLIQTDIEGCRETMRKLVLTDLINALIAILRLGPQPEAETYVLKALTGGILDKKTAKQLLSALPSSFS